MDKRKSLIDKIKSDLEESGYPLEIEVMKELLKNKWLVTPQYHYKDPIEGKERSVDFLCLKGGNIQAKEYERFYVNLIIECKKLEDKQWVLFTMNDAIGRENPEAYIQFVANSRDWMMNFETSLQIDNLHYNKEIPVALNHYIPFNKKDSLYEALNQSINGLYSKKKQVNKELQEHDFPVWNGYNMFVPIIVADSNLYQYNIASDEISEVDFLYYRTTGMGEIEDSSIVEIMRKDKLNDYLSKLNETIDQILKFIETYEPKDPNTV
ncbi:MAG: hypothetical protein NWE89_04275 [Candidatus Bathyarchaeota archaeon]|nr:hypothetical protein [Candidatus Bathyarchaeota archaeon]